MRLRKIRSGLYVFSRFGNPRRRVFSQFSKSLPSGVLSALIQIATAGILYLTYVHTVVPTQQKDLLAEEVAALKLKRGSIQQQLVVQREHLSGLSRQVSTESAEIIRLRVAKRGLSSDLVALNAKVREASAKAMNLESRIALNEKQILLDQVKLFRNQLELWQLSLLIPRDADELTRKVTYKIMVSPSETTNYVLMWPDYYRQTMSYASIVRSAKSVDFPLYFSTDFSAYLVAHARDFSCSPPTNDLVEAAFLGGYKSSMSFRKKNLEKQQDDLRKKSNSHIKYVFSDKSLSTYLEKTKADSESLGFYSVDKLVLDSQNKCNGKYLDFLNRLIAKRSKTYLRSASHSRAGAD